ncbi:phenylpropionate dioxygenase-like ring-hydroxylating dioxygenase large terminal subunit [Granulicella aggregans]|uniref:Phenylpropionate dioxygenase-like ring-hydroxylating dioxygenase large terminal subunit n=1 Tax=Granulicella aggregans TaxID=474949 RepID=A0A7W8E3N0_9BACT|nr:aromatic ring-hydroxylating dioxygenase subunit alpha [Granulicella aggregans]MBB5056300.1 phenylpropionate dioxygenase-like ring-hydroxylating dioxygenase large terminal subunit [Granulicella aggregans]
MKNAFVVASTASADSVQVDPVLRSQWFVVGQSSEVPPGQPVARRLLGTDIVLWRDSGEVHAWQDLCIHRGAKLSLGKIRDGCMVCPYHAWVYDGDGKCIHIPAQPDRLPPVRAGANVFHARERYGLVWVCVAEPSGDLPEFPLAEDESYRAFLCGPYRFEAKGPRLIENFLDVGHLAIVHAGLLGDEDHAVIPEYEVEERSADSKGPLARDIRIHQPDPDGTGIAAEVSYDYEVHAPLTASFVKSQGENKLFMGYTITPTEETSGEAWAVFAMNYGFEIPEEELRAFQQTVVMQDKAIVESQRPELLPLDLQEELHLRSDRMAIAYRRWLKATGLKYGVA